MSSTTLIRSRGTWLGWLAVALVGCGGSSAPAAGPDDGQAATTEPPRRAKCPSFEPVEGGACGLPAWQYCSYSAEPVACEWECRCEAKAWHCQHKPCGQSAPGDAQP